MVSGFCPCERRTPDAATEVMAIAATKIDPRCICPSIFTTDSRLEIQLRSELDEPSGEDARGPLPLRTVGVVLKHDWTCVQRIIEVQIHLQPSSARESK